MKKLTLLFSTLLISISITLGQSLSTVTYSVPNGNLPAIGSNFDVPVNVANFPGSLRFIEFTLNYDPAVLAFTGFDNLQHPGYTVWVDLSVSGEVKITYQDFPNTFSVTDGKLLDLQFDFHGGDSPLNFVSGFYRIGSTVYPIADFTNGTVLGGIVYNETFADGNWNDAATWTQPAAPNAFHNVLVQHEVDIIADAACNDLTIAVGGMLTLADGYALDVDGDLLIDSDITGTGSFVNLSAPLSLNGTVKQYLTGGYGATPPFGNWHLITVPVDAVEAQVVFWNCVLDRWNEAASSWQAVPPTEMLGNSMEGLAVAFHGAADKLLEFEGELNDGAYTIAVTNLGTSGDANLDGWNLVGNPYPSALNVDGPGWTRTNVSAGVAYWDETIGNYRYYGAEVPGNGGSQFVPPMQGFFVKASGAGTIGVSNAARAHTDQNFYKSDPANTLRLAVQHNDFSDEAVIRFVEDAALNYDEQYDFFKLFVDDVPMLYSVTALNEKLALNAMPEIDEDAPVNVGLQPGVNATMSLTASGMETFESSQHIWLYDHVAGVHWNLRENPVYNFIANVGDDENRFSIHFKNLTGVPGPDKSNISIYSYNRHIYVDAGSGNKGEIVVLNVLGQEVLRTNLTENLNVITVPVSNSNVVVKVISDQGISSRKVFVN